MKKTKDIKSTKKVQDYWANRPRIERFLIIGYGVVGKAVFAGLTTDSIKNNKWTKYSIDILDESAGYKLPHLDYSDYDGIIICVPTPEGPMGECNDMMVEQYYKDIRFQKVLSPILIKSTISIELAVLLENEDDDAITYSPEFLVEAKGPEQFLTQPFAIYGESKRCSRYAGRYWYHVFDYADVKTLEVNWTTMRNAAFVKYSINSFLAMKVVFFNELRSLYNDGIDDTNTETVFWELTRLISSDPRIGKSHIHVPGPDRKLGFGGKCFPKDTNAFTTYARNTGSPLKLLEKAIDINKEIRNEDSIIK